MRSAVLATVLVTGASGALSACGSDPAARTSPPTASVPPPASTAHLSTLAPASSAGGRDTPVDRAGQKASAALLAATDLPAGFSATPFTDTPYPQPCLPPGTSTVLEQYRPRTHVGRALALASPPAILTEQVDVFASDDEAAAALKAVHAGLQCTTGRLSVTGHATENVDVQGPADLRAILNVPVASVEGWTLQTGQLFESFVVARSGAVLTALTSLFPLDADAKKLPDGRAVAQTALRKVVAAKLG